MEVKRVVLTLVFIVLGFLISFSYQMAKKDTSHGTLTDYEWERKVELTEKLSGLEKRNRNLQHLLVEKQNQVMEMENRLAEEERNLSDMTKEAEQLRMAIGKVKVEGKGVIVTLNDGTYEADGGDVNDFLVHEHHVLKVVNELLISGAEAISINGKRITSHSYIVCNGPVITVDGEQFPAPFVIAAIGDPDTLEKALNMQGGVIDQLLADNLVVRVEKSSRIEMNPILSGHSTS
jgi:Bacterial protein of unknown function (DUF881).